MKNRATRQVKRRASSSIVSRTGGRGPAGRAILVLADPVRGSAHGLAVGRRVARALDRPGALPRSGLGDFHHPALPPRRLMEPRPGRGWSGSPRLCPQQLPESRQVSGSLVPSAEPLPPRPSAPWPVVVDSHVPLRRSSCSAPPASYERGVLLLDRFVRWLRHQSRRP